MLRAREVRELIAVAHDLAAPAPLEAKVARLLEGLEVLAPHATHNAIFFDPTSKARTVPLSGTVPPEALRAYAEHFIHVDPMTRDHRKAEFGPNLLSRVVDERELERTEYYADLLRPHGIREICGLQVRLPSERVIAIALHRPARMGLFGERELTAIRLLRPYMETGLYDAARVADEVGARFLVTALGEVVPLAASDGVYRGPPVPQVPDLAVALPDLARRLPEEARVVAVRIARDLSAGAPALAPRDGDGDAAERRLSDGRRVRYRVVRDAIAPTVEVTIEGDAARVLDAGRVERQGQSTIFFAAPFTA